MLSAHRNSVVKISTVGRRPNHYQPWKLRNQQTSHGSGCIIGDFRILTNAHVVAHAQFIQVQRVGDHRKYSASLLFIDHDTETAVLMVDSQDFFVGSQACTFGSLPGSNTAVVACGFTEGSSEMSVTAGIVSRVDLIKYTHSQRSLLAFQIDAALNPGNSGGPVFAGDSLVGLAFQSEKATDFENVGYVVPIPVIRHMLDDIQDGLISGVPDLGIYWQRTENTAHRKYLGLPNDGTGILVTKILPGSSADTVLREGDVLVEVSGNAVASDGSVEFRKHERINFLHIVNQRQVGATLDLIVIRQGRRLQVPVVLKTFVSLVPFPRPETEPRYLIYAGLVFIPLTYEYIMTWKFEDIHYRLKYLLYDALPTADRSEVVLLSEVLAHDINLGYHHVHAAVVTSVNGRRVGKMEDLVTLLESPQRGFNVIGIEHIGPRGYTGGYDESYGTDIVIEASQAKQATAEILEQHGILRDRAPSPQRSLPRDDD